MSLDTPKPCPCIVCGAQTQSAAAPGNGFDRVPHAGTLFNTTGHYGSTVFDPMDGSMLLIVVCDPCLLRLKDRAVVWQPPEQYSPWDPER